MAIESKKQKQTWQMIEEFLSERRREGNGNAGTQKTELEILKEMVDKYPAGSIERKVIEEEIVRQESL